MSAQVKGLLERLGLEQYGRPLIELGFDTLAKCRHLTDEMLIRAGVNLASHRRQILSAAVGRGSSGHMDTSLNDNDLYGNTVVAEMHKELQGISLAYALHRQRQRLTSVYMCHSL